MFATAAHRNWPTKGTRERQRERGKDRERKRREASSLIEATLAHSTKDNSQDIPQAHTQAYPALTHTHTAHMVNISHKTKMGRPQACLVIHSASGN